MKIECEKNFYYYGASVSNITLNKMIPVKHTKFLFDNLDPIRENISKISSTYNTR